MRNAGKCIRASGRWRIVIQMVLEDALREFIVENSKDALKRLVIESPRVCRERPLEVFDLVQFCALLR